MSEYGVGRETDALGDPGAAGEFGGELGGEFIGESVAGSEGGEGGDGGAGCAEFGAEPVEEPVEEYADPQEWIRELITDLERAEQGIGSGPRDVLMARIKLAQAYSELGDPAQAAPLAVANAAQAERLFPSSEGMLRQLREFRDAACEAAGWTAAMMRESEWAGAEGRESVPSELVSRVTESREPAPSELVSRATGSREPMPSELVSRAEAVASAAETYESAKPYDPSEDFSSRRFVPPAVPAPTMAEGHQLTDAEPAGAVIHEFVRRQQEPDALQWAAEVQAALTQPAELAIPTPPEPEYAEEVEPAAAPADLTDLSDLADLAAIEEIIRLRYELREAQRTIERLRHVNQKLREALEFDEGR